MAGSLCIRLLTMAALTIIATAPAGAFPISLQPSKDNTLYESATGNVSNGQGSYLFVGKNAGIISPLTVRRGLLAFDLSSIPPGSILTNATLTMSLSKSAPNAETVELRRVLADWGEGASNAASDEGGGAPAQTGDATWLHRSYLTTFWATPGGDFSSTISASTLVSNTLGSYSWSSAQLLADIQNWLLNPSSNFGWILLGDEAAPGTVKRFDSRNNSIPFNRPRLVVDFTPSQPLDHFLCYKAKNSAGPLRFTATPVSLSDQLMAVTNWQAFKPVSLCTPANKNGEGIFDDATHLEGYQLKAVTGTTPPAPKTVAVTNQFHMAKPLVVKTVKLDRLLVPTAKCVDNPAGTCPSSLPPPDPTSHVVDHYDCYTVTVQPDSLPFQAIENVSVDDQFIDPAKNLNLRKPTHLCVAADKNNEDIKRPLFNLMCYQARKAPGEPPHKKQRKLHVSNQFDEERMDTVKEEELCAPSSLAVQ